MKVATYNINGVVKRLPNLLAWLERARPDVVCLQEIKCRNSEFPHRDLANAGYGAIWRGQGPHHGVAMLARGEAPLETKRALPGDDADVEARFVEGAVGGILIASLYLPNGNPQPGPRFVYKLAWFERLIAYAETLIAADLPVVLAGDYNVVPTDADIYAMRSWQKNALTQPEPRALFARLCAQGWTDTLRATHPNDPMFTYWDVLRDGWSRDAGMRIDHLLVSPALSGSVRSAGVDRHERGLAGTSDHAPTWIEFEA